MSEVLNAEEARVVGALAEKQLATPQYYPLTLNALVNACNQSNNRDPVVSYDEATVQATFTSLREKGFARIVHPGSGSRVTKYRQVLDEALGLDAKELALICVLLLRGPQTLNELRTRTDRMAGFEGTSDVEHDLERLATREEPLVLRLGRQPGQREERFATTLTPLVEGAARAGSSAAGRLRVDRPVLPRAPRVAPVPDDAVTSGPQEGFVAANVIGGQLIGTVAHHPELLGRWLPFAGALLGAGRLSARHRALALLRTAYLTGAAYLWGHHAEMATAEVGLAEEDIARIPRGAEGEWTGLDALIIRASDEIHRDGLIADATWGGLAAELDERALVELPFLIGHDRMLAVVIASLGVQAEPGNPPLPAA